MIRTLASGVAVGSVVAVSFLAAPAYAQSSGLPAGSGAAPAAPNESPRDTTAQQSQNKPASATAPVAGAQQGVGDIIVTATRQSASMQHVPIAITALSGNTLARANITNLQGVQNLSPGIQISPQFKPGDAIFQIRGQVQTDAAPVIDPSVGVYFDDVYIARSAGSLLNLLDIERVEVLKGPQGTLFGKNTTGGAIRIISKQPTDRFEGYVDGSYESYKNWRLEGVLNVPLAEGLAARFAGQYGQKDGGYAINSFNNSRMDRQKFGNIRGTLRWTPDDRLKVQLTGDYSKITGGGLDQTLRYYVPGNGPASALEAAYEIGGAAAAFGPNGVAIGTAALNAYATGHGSLTNSTDMRDISATSLTFNPVTGQFTYVGGSINPTSSVKTWGVLANISYDAGFATLRSITAERHVNADYLYDVDGTVYHLLDSRQIVSNKQFSQELLMNGKLFDDRLDWTIGGLYFYETPFESDINLALAGLTIVSGGGTQRTNGSAKNKSYGLFGQGTFKLTDQLSVTAGARYSIDKRDFVGSAVTSPGVFSGGVFTIDNTTFSRCNYTVANGLALVPGFQAPCSIEEKATFKKWSYTASINYQIDPSKLLYVRTSRGYRAGGFNPRLNDPLALGAFLPEVVTDYELGLKADWFGHVLRTNLAVFTSKGSDVQQTVNAISPTTNQALTFTTNIGSRRVSGVELETVLRPTNWLSLNGGVSYLHARQTDPSNPEVNYVQATPKWAWNLGANVDAPLTSDFSSTLSVNLSHRGKTHDGPPLRTPASIGPITTAFIGYQRAITLLDVRYTIRHEPTGIELSVYGRNLTNVIYDARAYLVNGLGLGLGTVGEPRVIGVELKVPFGHERRSTSLPPPPPPPLPPPPPPATQTCTDGSVIDATATCPAPPPPPPPPPPVQRGERG